MKRFKKIEWMWHLLLAVINGHFWFIAYLLVYGFWFCFLLFCTIFNIVPFCYWDNYCIIYCSMLSIHYLNYFILIIIVLSFFYWVFIWVLSFRIYHWFAFILIQAMLWVDKFEVEIHDLWALFISVIFMQNQFCSRILQSQV